jgi:hypothetical protein
MERNDDNETAYLQWPHCRKASDTLTKVRLVDTLLTYSHTNF